MDDCCYMLYQQCHRRYLELHVNNALTFVVTNTVMQRGNVRSIFYALQSLDARTSMDEYKFRMGYTPRSVRQRVVFNPWVSPLVNGVTHAVLKRIVNVRSGDPTLSKAEGLMRFYVEGKRPLHEQSLPEPLRKVTNNS